MRAQVEETIEVIRPALQADGGDIVLRVDLNVTTLVDYHHEPHRRAGNGGQGAGGNKNGANGDDLVLPVPDGTVVATTTGDVLADLLEGDASANDEASERVTSQLPA